MTTNLDREYDGRKPRQYKWSYIVFDLPGWNSLEDVTRYHRWAEIIGIVVLAFLVIAEVASYRYGARKDDLASKQQEATDQRHDEEMARLHLATAAANERAENARLEQERLKQIVNWRTINPTDLNVLITELENGNGEIDLAYIPGDPESEYFALKIIGDAFIAANKTSDVLKWHVYLRRWNSDTMFFGIAIPGPDNAQVTILRRAFSAAHIEFTTENAPDEIPPMPIGAGLSWTPAAKHDALIFVGLKSPPL